MIWRNRRESSSAPHMQKIAAHPPVPSLQRPCLSSPTPGIPWRLGQGLHRPAGATYASEAARASRSTSEAQDGDLGEAPPSLVIYQRPTRDGAWALFTDRPKK